MFKRSDPHSAQCPVDVLCVDVSQMWQKYFIGTFCNLATSNSNSIMRAARSAADPMAARHARASAANASSNAYECKYKRRTK